MSDALSVKVNGASWKLFLIRVDDEADEALIIIYGLMPGRQYDIELGVLPGGRESEGTNSNRVSRCASLSFVDPQLLDLISRPRQRHGRESGRP